MPCIVKPECISIRSIREVGWSGLPKWVFASSCTLGLWITGQGSPPNLSCYIPGFQQSTAVSQCKFHNFTWYSQFVHPSSERNKLPFVPCSVQGDSHLSMFPKNWQQPDLHKPGDRVFFSSVFQRVYTFLVSHNSLGNTFPFSQSLWSLLLYTS